MREIERLGQAALLRDPTWGAEVKRIKRRIYQILVALVGEDNKAEKARLARQMIELIERLSAGRTI